MGGGHPISAATTSRSQGRGMTLDSGRQRNMSNTGQGNNSHLIFNHFLDDVLYTRNSHHFCLIICQELLFGLIVLRHLHRSFPSKGNKIINIVTVDFVAFQVTM